MCAHLERQRAEVLSRQLGTSCHGARVMDIVAVEPGPEFDERAAITEETIPPAAIESAVGPGTARPWPEVYDGHPERAEEVCAAAVDCGFFERERRGGQTYVRQTTRYPDWYGRLLGIENKPDLGSPGALERQLLTDVKLALLDQVVLATESYVTGAHENRIPDPVGIWRFDPDSGEREVIREPEQLPVGEPGVELLDRRSARTDIAVVTPEEIERQRRRVAERAYGKGWRSYDLPPCSRIEPDEDGLPICPWKGGVVDAARTCGEDCEGFEPAEPPEIDLDEIRSTRSPWEPEPEGRQRRQSGLDRFR
nr:DUF5787 family protein [Halovenus carboxidivorans]